MFAPLRIEFNDIIMTGQAVSVEPYILEVKLRWLDGRPSYGAPFHLNRTVCS